MVFCYGSSSELIQAKVPGGWESLEAILEAATEDAGLAYCQGPIMQSPLRGTSAFAERNTVGILHHVKVA